MASARTDALTPGSVIWEPIRTTTRSPSVKSIRVRSSSILKTFRKLSVNLLISLYAAGVIFCAVPPAVSIFATAVLLNACAVTCTFAFRSPSPRIFTGALFFEVMPIS